VDPATLERLTGMYRKVRDNTVVELGMKNGKLALDGRTDLTPAGSGKFIEGERQFVFEGAGFREVDENGETLYERVEPVHPSESDLTSLVGAYSSQDTASMVLVSVKGTDLTLAIASGAPVTLRPTFRDAFMMPRGGMAIRFLRDSAGNVTGFSAGDDRAWDIRFTRVAAPNRASNVSE
jgi:hypothetical protein